MMKKVSFLVALLAIVQMAMGQRNAQAQQTLRSDRLAVEEALDRAGEEVGDELERLFEELGVGADQLSQALERFAEDNAQELDNWSAKYAKQWEEWGNRFEQKLHRMAQEQEGNWQTWSKKYEQNLNRWVGELESDQLNPEHLGEFVEQNLNMLSKMPLGQMVDQVLEDGIGELSAAPWESLEELGALAKDAFDEPLGELESSFNQLNDGISRNISDAEVQQTDSNIDPRVRALQELRQRDNATPAQRLKIDHIIRSYLDTKDTRQGANDSADRPRIDVPRGDQIRQKIEREKSRQQQSLQQFNDDLRRSSEESRKTELKARELDSRKPKRVDGKHLDPNSKGNQKSDKQRLGRVKREARSTQSSSSQSSSRGTKQTSTGREIDSDLDMLRQEIEKLRNEIKRLKDESGN